MPGLHQLDCKDNDEGLEAMDRQAIESHLAMLEPAWTYLEDDALIQHRFSFGNYYQTMAFTNVVAQIAHQQDHHPDMLISYNQCTVSFSTHSVGGVSLKDFICAAKINASLNL